uniref:Uncharacterized protein n=1 Tax=Babesia bovis TaxID=5865 RepID=S6AZH5_BABBO|nr:hypothetical protein [Babesia bovis]
MMNISNVNTIRANDVAIMKSDCFSVSFVVLTSLDASAATGATVSSCLPCCSVYFDSASLSFTKMSRYQSAFDFMVSANLTRSLRICSCASSDPVSRFFLNLAPAVALSLSSAHSSISASNSSLVMLTGRP